MNHFFSPLKQTSAYTKQMYFKILHMVSEYVWRNLRSSMCVLCMQNIMLKSQSYFADKAVVFPV